MKNFEIIHHSFTDKIISILERYFQDHAIDVFSGSPLLGYLNIKTKSANRGSKARAAFANHYALYVVVEDYINKGFLDGRSGVCYSEYEGARFSDLLKRQRELPFGTKLQNHALNSRLNDEFRKFYPALGTIPIVRDVTRQRYWIQEDLLQIVIRNKEGKDISYNIAPAIIDIIDAYIDAKRAAFEVFLRTCNQMAKLGQKNSAFVIEFIMQQLAPNVDARVFEIVSYAILKAKFGQESIWIGFDRENVTEEFLKLYKTGRTNANDGGIDFVMKPLGRFFQVTETIDVRKFFLDIDKIQKFPISFVVKTTENPEKIRQIIREKAQRIYKIEKIVDDYMGAIEAIINIESLIEAFQSTINSGRLSEVMREIIAQSMMEFNYIESEDEARS